MTPRACALVVLTLASACGSVEAPAVEVEPELATCPVACGSLELVGPLLKLTPSVRSLAYYTRLERTSTGWVAAWHSDVDYHSYLQRIDADGMPVGNTVGLLNGQGLELEWNGKSLALWSNIYPWNPDPIAPRERAYVELDATLSPTLSTMLAGPDWAMPFAFDFGGVHTLALVAPQVGLRVTTLRILPGPALEQKQHFLSQAPEAVWRAGVGFTGQELLVTYLSPRGYLATFLDPSTLEETQTVELGSATGETPQDVKVAVGDTLIWVAVWEMKSQHLWLRALDRATGAPTGSPLLLPWVATLTNLIAVGDAPFVTGSPPHMLGEPENDAFFPIDPETGSICTGTRLGRANIAAIDLQGGEGAVLLEQYQQLMYFSRIRCAAAL